MNTLADHVAEELAYEVETLRERVANLEADNATLRTLYRAMYDAIVGIIRDRDQKHQELRAVRREFAEFRERLMLRERVTVPSRPAQNRNQRPTVERPTCH